MHERDGGIAVDRAEEICAIEAGARADRCVAEQPTAICSSSLAR
jgi:hypothetical protein